MWLSKRSSDGKSTEVTYHRLLPGQQLQLDEAMVKELSQILAADAVRHLAQEEELNLKPERWLRMRWVLTWKYTEGGDRNAKARLVILGCQHPQKLSQLGWRPMSTDQCLWCRYSDHGELKGVIGIHVDDLLIGLADGGKGEKWMSERKSLYRWGSWKTSESEFAGIRVRQQRDFSRTVDLEDCTNKFITEAPRQESLTARELSMLRGVLGTASCRCEFAVKCNSSARGARSAGRQQVGPRHASQCCTGSSRSLFLQVSESCLRLVVACGAFGQPTAFPCGHRCTVGTPGTHRCALTPTVASRQSANPLWLV